MRVLNPLNNGPTIREQVIYVDHPEIVQKYEAQLKAIEADYNQRNDLMNARIKELGEVVDQQASQLAINLASLNAPLRAVPTPTDQSHIEALKLSLEVAEERSKSIKKELIYYQELSKERFKEIDELRSRLSDLITKDQNQEIEAFELEPVEHEEFIIPFLNANYGMYFVFCLLGVIVGALIYRSFF